MKNSPSNGPFNPLIQLLERHMDTMGRSQKTIAQFLITNPSSAVGLSLEELAQETKTSRATVLRLCKELGLNGYKELQQYLMRSALRGVPDTSGDETLRWCFTAASEAVTETLSLLNTIQFSRAVKMCIKARSIVWYGLGDSGTLAQSGQHKCWVLGMDSKAFIDPSSFATSRAAVSENDVFIAISQSGEGDYLSKPVQVAITRGTPVIGITSNKFSWLASNATVSLVTATRKVFSEYGLISVRAGQEAIVNALILKTAGGRGIPFSLHPVEGKGEWLKRDLD